MTNGFNWCVLPSRTGLRISGGEATEFLQNLISNDAGRAGENLALYASLLTPQGKLLYDFFIHRHEGSYMLDIAKKQAEALHAKLAFYRLGADIVITPEDEAIYAVWGGALPAIDLRGLEGFADPRHRALGKRLYHCAAPADGREQDEEAYYDYCIERGAADPAREAEAGACFPHEFNLDLMHGLDFTKGCFVGQEVVSRIERRARARSRTMIARRQEKNGQEGVWPEAGTEITAGGEAVVGVLGSGQKTGDYALARIRLDRLKRAENQVLHADGLMLTLTPPELFPFTEAE